MYRRIEDFVRDWQYEVDITAKVMGALTEASLAQTVVPGHRTLGRIAWHLAQSIPEMMCQAGLSLSEVDPNGPVPGSLAEIRQGYESVAAALAGEVNAKWKDADLEKEDNMYGETWKRGLTLRALLMHQSHHRGQMTVLMRQAGLRVPGIYGPALEDWAAYGQPVPAV
ncbi:MAG TPA: DinB family protein [bacterium]|nr:DinB family protein [bacterium]